MLESHTRQIETIDTREMRRARKNEKRTTKSNEITGGWGFNPRPQFCEELKNYTNGISSNGPNLSEFILSVLKSHIHIFIMLPACLQNFKRFLQKL